MNLTSSPLKFPANAEIIPLTQGVLFGRRLLPKFSLLPHLKHWGKRITPFFSLVFASSLNIKPLFDQF